MLVKRIAACTHLSSTVYEILVGNCNFFLPVPLHLTPRLGVFPFEFREKVCSQNTRIMGLTCMQSRQFDNRLSRFDTIPACDGRTDGWTDRQTDVQPVLITCAV